MVSPPKTSAQPTQKRRNCLWLGNPTWEIGIPDRRHASDRLGGAWSPTILYAFPTSMQAPDRQKHVKTSLRLLCELHSQKSRSCLVYSDYAGSQLARDQVTNIHRSILRRHIISSTQASSPMWNLTRSFTWMQFVPRLGNETAY